LIFSPGIFYLNLDHQRRGPIGSGGAGGRREGSGRDREAKLLDVDIELRKRIVSGT